MFDDSLVKFAQRLIRQSSLSGKEDALVKTVVGEMQHLGYDQAWIDKVGNAVGVIVGDKAGPTLLIDGHCDTVGVAPGVAWTQDPLGAEIVGDFMYGRGAADMKGALAAMVYAAAGIDRTRLSGRVVVSATVMEENLEGAALQTVIEALQPKFVVIGEATDLNLNPSGNYRSTGPLIDTRFRSQRHP
jgi:acetylornithine deacetylase/succinyl-diaminopimelate desuccinylase-like protein